MFSFLKKIDINLYNETETLRKIFQSGENLPYLNQSRDIFEGLLDYLALKNAICLNEKTLGAKLNNKQISFVLYDELHFDKTEVEAIRKILNDSSHYNVNKEEYENSTKLMVMKFLYISIKTVMEKYHPNVKISNFNIEKCEKFIEYNDISQQLAEKQKKLEKIEETIQEKYENSLILENKIKELETTFFIRQNEIYTIESNPTNNDLYDLGNGFVKTKDFIAAEKVFLSLKTANIMDLRAYVGLLLCYYKVENIEELITCAVSNNVNLYNNSIYIDTQKFLKNIDKEFFQKIANRIEIEKLYQESIKLLNSKNFEEAKIIVDLLKNKGVDYDLDSLELEITNEPLYLRIPSLLEKNKYAEAIELLTKISNYKDSEKILKKVKRDYDKYILLQQEEERKKKLAIELEKRKQIEERKKQAEYNKNFNKSEGDKYLKLGIYEKAISYYLKANENCFHIEETYLAFDSLFCDFESKKLNKEILNEKITELLCSLKNKYNNIENILEEVKTHHKPIELIEKKHKIEKLLLDVNEDNLLCAYEIFAKDYRIEQNYGNIILSSLNKYVNQQNPTKDFLFKCINFKWKDAVSKILDFYIYTKSNLSTDCINEIIFILESDQSNFVQLNFNYEISKLKSIECDKFFEMIELFFSEKKFSNIVEELEKRYSVSVIELSCLEILSDRYKMILIKSLYGCKKYGAISAIYDINANIVIEFLLNSIQNDKDIIKYINDFRGTSIEKYIIQFYIKNKMKENINNINLDELKTAKFYMKRVDLVEAYANIIKSKQDILNQLEKSYIEKKRFKTLILLLSKVIGGAGTLVLYIISCGYMDWHIAGMFSSALLFFPIIWLFWFYEMPNKEDFSYEFIKKMFKQEYEKFHSSLHSLEYYVKLALYYGYDDLDYIINIADKMTCS